jgi:hypothetical protein
MVGSTAYKQQARFPIGDAAKGSGEIDLTPNWMSPITDFFSSFTEALNQCWDEKKAWIAQQSTMTELPIGENPEIWKANGDELIFTKELSDRREIHIILVCWMDAIKLYRKSLPTKKRLDVKSCIWFAGFPITNSEIIFSKNTGAIRTRFNDDPRLDQYYLLENWYEKPESRENLIQDFLGPSIDTGFRLAAQATPRKMIVSIEVAYLLSAAKMPTGKKVNGYLDWPKIVYDGRVDFKGVLGGKPYPVFWIDLHSEDKETAIEDNLTQPPKPLGSNEIELFCESFFSQHESVMLKPFIYNDAAGQYGDLPENYVEHLLRLSGVWQEEKRRYDGELNPIDEDAIKEDESESRPFLQLLKELLGDYDKDNDS